MLLSFLSHGNADEPNHRITVAGLMAGLDAQGIATCFAAPDMTARPDLLFAVHDIDFGAAPVQAILRAARERKVPLAFWVNDLEPQHHQRLQQVLGLADLLVVPTSLHAAFLSSLTPIPVIVLEDMIDPALGPVGRRRHADQGETLGVLWFGYPQSYQKSMQAWHPELLGLAAGGRIRYTICTLNQVYGVIAPNVEVCRYEPRTIGARLQEHDCCVLSHTAWDYQVSTFVKSENKLTLAIAAGTPCVTSRTPAYAGLLARQGLAEFAVASIPELLAGIERLRPAQARNAYLDKSWNHVVDYYSPHSAAARFLAALAELPHLKAA